LVSLRTTRNVLDLHTVRTQLAGEFAYPMFARGQLLGVMVLGPKVSGESYAPDESSALEQIASAIASTLDALTLSASGRNDALVEGILSIQESLADMSARIRRLDARTSGEAQAEREAIEPS